MSILFTYIIRKTPATLLRILMQRLNKREYTRASSEILHFLRSNYLYW